MFLILVVLLGKADAGKVELQLIESAQLTSSESRPA